MENFQVYRDIQARTGGDIYIGVVGPVRTGKSTFIRRFMELVALPQMSDTKQAEPDDSNRSKKQNRRRLFPVQEERSDKATREGKNRGGRNIERAQSLLHRRHRHHSVYQQARHGMQRGGRPDH